MRLKITDVPPMTDVEYTTDIPNDWPQFRTQTIEVYHLYVENPKRADRTIMKEKYSVQEILIDGTLNVIFRKIKNK